MQRLEEQRLMLAAAERHVDAHRALHRVRGDVLEFRPDLRARTCSLELRE
ncbi:MAG: hypothetical protein M3229_00570 [Actinomycetota bacterium]|nr:hypothetical protein [Actinomycetota bacterium]